CDSCEGLLKPATISFGQAMPERETTEAYRRSEQCEVFIVIGSSLVVQPAAYMPMVAKRGGAKLVIINRDETSCDHLADIIVNGSAGATMAAIVEMVKQSMG
ncbi:MAG TPA: sigma factor regulator FecR, partial [Deltaproteobacteria bacterium]|nr:sigma factor regulator FecR [Deltaproteobacteria bacterium]